ncbi:hypothetical protein RB620_10350 [Paenibacillus sp. LHD-117]|uniref:hypothetical protein n=1 Tax=Paenibacillus sp. LHD-117 TaxID=3071412 RepID=UPI0027E032A6|nr:hypothetical protein [Paenibacillus sp. LHD-117]MDQ6419832.1 hypothetical protein [Paenibacillus sp. LHD-117]
MDFLDFSAYDTETWTTFLQENWLVLVIALVALLLIVRVVKTVVKWALAAVIVIGVVLYSGYSLDDVKEIGTKMMDTVKQEAVTAMIGEAENAEYKVNEDGTYTVTTSNIELTGEVGASEVKVSLKGAPAITLQLDDAILTFIEQAKQNG